MLLKIGQRYINTEKVTKWLVGKSESGNRELWAYTDGDADSRFNEPAEIDALLRWLNENSTDIMATEAAPPEPRFKAGDRVRITKETSVLDRPYVGQIGVIDEVVADNTFPYWVKCDAGTEQFNDDQLEPAE